MNANELIKKLERAKGIVYNEMGCDELIVLAIEESEKILSRTRIRATDEEPCEYCEGIGLKHGPNFYVTFNCQTSVDDDYEIDITAKYCPNCGRQLPEVTP